MPGIARRNEKLLNPGEASLVSAAIGRIPDKEPLAYLEVVLNGS